MDRFGADMILLNFLSNTSLCQISGGDILQSKGRGVAMRAPLSVFMARLAVHCPIVYVH